MVCQKQQTTAPMHWQIANRWSALLSQSYPKQDTLQLEAHACEAMNDFAHFLDGSAATWDLYPLMLTLSSQPALTDLMRVFMTLRGAVRAVLAGEELPVVAYVSERLDAWIEATVNRYNTVRSYCVHKHWAEMVKRIAQLNTLSYCMAELNASLDLISAYKATAQLVQVLTGADLCLVFERVGDALRLKAHVGEGVPANAVIEITNARLLDELVVGTNHHDLAIETVRATLGVPQAQAMHSTPLQVKNVITGKLMTVYFKDKTFSPQELRVQEIFSGHAAQAIYNAELYERLSHLTAAGERRRLACEMHDTMLQTMISLNINLRVMGNHLEQGDWEGAQPLLEEARHLGKLAVQEGRDTLNSLREVDEDCARERNLLDALQAELATFAERSGIQPELTIQGEPWVSLATSHQLCRLVGEALTNIHRHARASAVRVVIEADAHELRLQVMDDGVGFLPERIDHLKSFGLVGMQERARLMNARLEIRSAPGQGTLIAVCCPVTQLQDTP